MRKLEYFLSVLMALGLVGGLTAWTHATGLAGEIAVSCRAGKVPSPVVLKGMSLTPPCPAGKPG